MKCELCAAAAHITETSHSSVLGHSKSIDAFANHLNIIGDVICGDKDKRSEEHVFNG